MKEDSFKTIALDFNLLEEKEMFERAEALNNLLQKRRTVRAYSDKSVPRQIIEQCLLAANSAPSGANRQPWHFAVVSSAIKKKEIREGAEEEEREFYNTRAPQDWLKALAPLGTNANKPFLEKAPYLIVIFGQKFMTNEKGQKLKNYYVAESVGIATGLLIAALHNAGLATLTHTPAPMKFLNKILDRPNTERPIMILVVGYPEQNAQVPDITRKSLEQFTSFHDE
ncbi:MAG: nitroreductase family protein [Gammaproteobacteria bacterium]|nr:nitroreductase family protein [Gammaproteobacteria bacterium]|tara:strand:- start:236 stop:913 length:678 start_codon:yes stop_codon:yes gene_type:complete